MLQGGRPHVGPRWERYCRLERLEEWNVVRLKQNRSEYLRNKITQPYIEN